MKLRWLRLVAMPTLNHYRLAYFACAGALPTARNPVAAGRPVVEPAPEHKIDLTSPFARIAHHASRSGDAVLGDTLLLKAGPEPFGTQAANWLASL